MLQKRAAGILLHLTSLPSRFGIGDMGAAAFEFIDFLAAAGQSVWQILPLCPTTKGDSPYSSYSAFAGNPLLISPESLVADGWLAPETLSQLQQTVEVAAANQVDFESVTNFKRALLLAAWNESKSRLVDCLPLQQFCVKQAWWLDDFAAFETFQIHFGEDDWTQWPEPYRFGDAVGDELIFDLQDQIEFAKFKQFLFETQWQRLKAYANKNKVSICGDMPIFVAHESADVWANRDQFLLDASGRPAVVAGVPPDYFSETGQLWGNPIYDWNAMEADGFAWWVSRFRRALEQFDVLRVDHFRGFDRYWEIPADAETAACGSWKAGPRHKPFHAAEQALGRLPIWAEDLGNIDQSVHELRDELGFPTMRVLQFGYSHPDDDFHRHTNYQPHCIAYTGTHDNATLMEWFNSRKQELASRNETVDVLDGFLGSNVEVNFQLSGLVYDSAADVAIVPLQDFLGLGPQARMNVPGTAEGNWRWRASPSMITLELAARIRLMAARSRRLNGAH